MGVRPEEGIGGRGHKALGASSIRHSPPIDGMFRQPTDVAWDSGGNIYITDGYINSRVAKYDKDGDWVKSWGTKGTGPGQFVLPHSLAIDHNDNIYVGDRSNHRIQVFDTDGKFQRMFPIDVPPDPETRAVYGATPTGERLKEVIGAPNSHVHHAGPESSDFRRRNRHTPDGSSRFRSTARS